MKYSGHLEVCEYSDQQHNTTLVILFSKQTQAGTAQRGRERERWRGRERERKRESERERIRE